MSGAVGTRHPSWSWKTTGPRMPCGRCGFGSAAGGYHQHMASADSRLTFAVTGPTGTFGFGLMPLLQEDSRISRIIGIARRPFEPAEHGWTKMEYRQGDVRNPKALENAFQGADVVIHLAFMITGTSTRQATREINIDGTLNAFRAAAAAGASRFVYASSVAAYGFHRDNPIGMTEDWPVRPATRLFYAQEKAELEQLLQAESIAYPTLDLYLLRPPVVLGPHAVGAKDALPGSSASCRYRCPPASCNRPPERHRHCRRCRSPRRPWSGSRRPATLPSWMPARRSGSWAGSPATQAWRRCERPSRDELLITKDVWFTAAQVALVFMIMRVTGARPSTVAAPTCTSAGSRCLIQTEL